ncbi:MAG: ExeA family protein [Lysobacterales bacterium]
MYRQHFGITACPLDKGSTALFDDGQLSQLNERFQWLIDSPGVGLLTGEAGVGKTAALRHFTSTLNPHRYQVIYSADTDCSRRDIYRNLAIALGLEPAYRRTQLWHDLKERILDLADNKQVQLMWVIDEAQNLSTEFFRDFPAFLNFAFDARDLMTVWFVGLPRTAYTIDRSPNVSLASRIHVRLQLQPIQNHQDFEALVKHAFAEVGCTQTLLSDSGLELLRQASQGKPRQAGQILKAALRLATPRGLSHLPDELIQEAVEVLR